MRPFNDTLMGCDADGACLGPGVTDRNSSLVQVSSMSGSSRHASAVSAIASSPNKTRCETIVVFQCMFIYFNKTILPCCDSRPALTRQRYTPELTTAPRWSV